MTLLDLLELTSDQKKIFIEIFASLSLSDQRNKW